LAVDVFAKAYGIFQEKECDECGQKETDGKCTNPTCCENPDYEECYECGEALLEGECQNKECKECPEHDEDE
jgi:hypothetical protein